jgi:cell division protein FtsN
MDEGRMKMRRIVIGVAGLVTVSSIAFLGCVPEKKHSAQSSDSMEQNALDAEKAEQLMADASAGVDVKMPAGKVKVKAKKASKTTDATAAKHRQPASVSGSYIVQVGAFRVKENAEKLNTKLQGIGYKSTLQAMNHSKNGQLYLVQMEPSKNRADAESLALKLKENSFDSQIVRK